MNDVPGHDRFYPPPKSDPPSPPPAPPPLPHTTDAPGPRPAAPPRPKGYDPLTIDQLQTKVEELEKKIDRFEELPAGHNLRGRIVFEADFVRQCLALPDGVCIVGAEADVMNAGVMFTIMINRASAAELVQKHWTVDWSASKP